MAELPLAGVDFRVRSAESGRTSRLEGRSWRPADGFGRRGRPVPFRCDCPGQLPNVRDPELAGDRPPPRVSLAGDARERGRRAPARTRSTIRRRCSGAQEGGRDAVPLRATRRRPARGLPRQRERGAGDGAGRLGRLAAGRGRRHRVARAAARAPALAPRRGRPRPAVRTLRHRPGPSRARDREPRRARPRAGPRSTMPCARTRQRRRERHDRHDDTDRRRRFPALVATILTSEGDDFNDDLAALGPRALAARLASLLGPGS